MPVVCRCLCKFIVILCEKGLYLLVKPNDQPISLNAWNFVIEEIEGAGGLCQYSKKLCRLSGNPDYLTDIADCTDLAGETVLYKIYIEGG